MLQNHTEVIQVGCAKIDVPWLFRTCWHDFFLGFPEAMPSQGMSCYLSGDAPSANWAHLQLKILMNTVIYEHINA